MTYIFIFLISFTLTYVVKKYAIKKSLLAEVNERSSHTVPTPHGGGIAVAISWFLGLFYLYFNGNIDERLFWALNVGMVISIVSYLDDLYELSPKIRLISQAGVAVGALVALGGLNSLELGIITIESQIITNVIAFIAIIWFINLYNFLDGIDGYAGSEAIFLAFAGFIIFGGDHFMILAASILGFLVWNWHKAKIFMGDVGSTLLGYTVAIFSIYYSNHSAENLWVWIILFGIFWFDATLTLFRRYKNKEKLSEAHRKHAYQRLTQGGWSHDKVVKYSIGVNLILFLVVYLISNILAAFVLSIIILYLSMLFVDSKIRFK